ncbi:MAG: iron-sulfur cluster assembly scaffold protein [Candidatus Thermoplasmatota archaeon]|nr:iron-sulfur cluster assembly scaffold protein [Candidatus Thermoplasmatota archaeon]MCL5731494.1 iron-sulfur cluster assembly scaffold protein [Candidatus Thermoplasmatota archaeon]
MSEDLAYEVLMDHYRNPHNYGSVKDFTHGITEYNPICGDTVHIEMHISNGIIDEIKFMGRGCSISQASASILTETVKGMPAAEAAAITDQDYLLKLGVSLGPAREKCALLSLNAMRKSLSAGGSSDGQ